MLYLGKPFNVVAQKCDKMDRWDLTRLFWVTPCLASPRSPPRIWQSRLSLSLDIDSSSSQKSLKISGLRGCPVPLRFWVIHCIRSKIALALLRAAKAWSGVHRPPLRIKYPASFLTMVRITGPLVLNCYPTAPSVSGLFGYDDLIFQTHWDLRLKKLEVAIRIGSLYDRWHSRLIPTAPSS